MAQSVEHILGKDEVISSNLISSSRQPRGEILGALVFYGGKCRFFSALFSDICQCEKTLKKSEKVLKKVLTKKGGCNIIDRLTARRWGAP